MGNLIKKNNEEMEKKLSFLLSAKQRKNAYRTLNKTFGSVLPSEFVRLIILQLHTVKSLFQVLFLNERYLKFISQTNTK